jgi:toxin YoeB
MKFVFTSQFKKDISKFKSENPKLGFKILALLDSIDDNERTPLQGEGNPELLKNLGGTYSRRITGKHRLTYRIDKNEVYLLSCYGHYGDK